MYDSKHKEKLIQEIEAKLESVVFELEGKYAAAVEFGQESYATTEAYFNELSNNLINWIVDQSGELARWVDENNAQVAAEGQSIHDGFVAAANAENDALNAALDELVRKWAWWLLKFYSYKNYDESVYEGYDPHYDDEWFEQDLEDYTYDYHKDHGYG